MYIHTIDIAHPPLTSGAAEEILNEAVSYVRSARQLRALKVVHGYGSSGGKSILKEVVRNWSYRNSGRLLAVIPGEEYNMFDKKTVKMRKICGQISDPDFGASNQGITVFWIK